MACGLLKNYYICTVIIPVLTLFKSAAITYLTCLNSKTITSKNE